MSDVTKLLWIDLETTGLNPYVHEAIEIYAELRDINNTVIGADVPRVHEVLYLSDKQLIQMDRVVLDMHGRSGLIGEARCVAPGGLAVVAAWFRDIMKNCPNEKLTLAGNSVHFDLGFLRYQMLLPYETSILDKLSHRVFDVSAIQMACVAMGMVKPPKPDPAPHRAKEDVEASLKLANYCFSWLDSDKAGRAMLNDVATNLTKPKED